MKMKLAIVAAICGLAGFAQMVDNRDKKLSCDNNGESDRPRHCQMSEQTVPAMGRLNVDAGKNGGVTVKGWLQNSVLVRTRIEASAETESAASLMASQVHVDASGGQVRATGPDAADNAWWSVSYEIFVPQTTDLTLKAHNGGVTISDVRGQIQFEAQNGGVHLRRIAGDVNGSTVNGGIQVELAGNSWEGRQLDVTTKNGGVTVSMPEHYSAHLQTETVNGGVQSDFETPASPDGRRARRLDFNVGSGGPLIHVSTTNGGVKVKKI